MHLIRYHVEYTYITVYRNDDKIYLSAKQTYISMFQSVSSFMFKYNDKHKSN